MSDERLRELERRWLESGAIDHKAAWLRERLRLGRLDPKRLELAAYLGDPAASAAGAAVHDPPTDGRALGRWARGLKPFDKDACPRAAVAAGKAAARLWLEAPERDPQLARFRAEGDPLARRFGDVSEWAGRMLTVLAAVEAWIDRPQRAEKEALEALAPEVDPDDRAWLMHVPGAVHAGFVWCLRKGPRRAAVMCADYAVSGFASALRGSPPGRKAEALAARAVVRDALLPWALA